MLMINPDRHSPDDWGPDDASPRSRFPFFALPLIFCGVAFDIYSFWVAAKASVWGTVFAGTIVVGALLYRMLWRGH